jgi:hypothetical protein
MTDFVSKLNQKLNRGESSEAAISRHATAENATQREFQKNFSTFTLK